MNRLSATLKTLGFQPVLKAELNGDVGLRFSNSTEFGRFVSEAVRLLSGDEIVRIGNTCMVTLNRHAARLICERAQ